MIRIGYLNQLIGFENLNIVFLFLNLFEIKVTTS
jgi:hypothetical protein